MASKLQSSSFLALVAAVVLVAGCGKEGDKAATQVAAKVNKEEISVHQINYVLARAGQIAPEQQEQASRQALEKLIEQEMLVQKAMASKIDRDPNVMQSIESGRRQILAQAYLAKVAAGASKPAAAEIHDYFEKHPELFSQRRIYRFQRLSLTADKTVAAEVKDKLSAGRVSMNDLVALAKEKNIRYEAGVVTKPAEQLPLELLPQLKAMKEGQMGMMEEPFGVSVIQLLAFQEQPVDEKAATPVIEQFLVNKQKNELVLNEVKQLKSSASIEYVGDFAKKPEEKAAEAAAAVVAKAETPKSTADEAVSKGVSGLK